MKKIFKILLIMLLPTFTMANERIVVIGSGAGETVSALGFANQVVATDLTSRHLPEYKKTAVVGYIRSISAENIISVKPTIIIAEYGTGPQNQLKILQSAFKRTYVMPTPNSLNDVYGRIKYVGQALNAESKADEIIANMKQKYKIVQSKLNKTGKAQKVMVVMLRSGLIIAAGDNSGLGRIVKMAKGDNIFSGINNYRNVTNEAIINMNPDIILYFNHGKGKNIKQEIYDHIAMKTTNAVKNNKVYEVDTYLLVSYGPRTVDAIESLGKIFYPNLFK